MPGWLRLLLTRQMLICVFTGFSSGLPLYLLLNLLPAWLCSDGVDLRTIGLFALIQYSLFYNLFASARHFRRAGRMRPRTYLHKSETQYDDNPSEQ